MLLAVDVGNTNINFAVFKSERIIKKFSVPTAAFAFSTLYKKLGKLKIEDCIVSSVVPPVNAGLEKILKKISGRAPYMLGKNIRVPVKNLYRKPGQVGQDRLVNSYAGIKLFGAPVVIVDFGTAVTFDVVSRKGDYLGGMILPGLGISLSALAERTALLPRVKLKKPAEFIGRDTENSMLSGIIYGFASLTDELARRIKLKIGRRALVLGTGGNIGLISGYCRCFDKVDTDLTLKGLNLIYRKQNLRKELKNAR